MAIARVERSKSCYTVVLATLLTVWIIYWHYFTKPVTDSFEMGASRSGLKMTPEESYDSSKLKIMTWNLQGLKSDALAERTSAAISEIKIANPDVIFFQELVPSSFTTFCKALDGDYKCVDGKRSVYSGYFVGIFYKTVRFKLEDQTKIPFKKSGMDRLLLIVKLSLLGKVKTKLAVMTSHLESLRWFSDQRQEQLKESFQVGSSFPENYNVIFGGDLNLEEGEEMGIVPSDFKDLWEECGSPDNIRYTWDATKNHNEVLRGGQQLQVRYDRLYFRPSNPKRMHFINLDLLGKQLVQGTEYFPSDHWAIISTFQLSDQDNVESLCKAK